MSNNQPYLHPKFILNGLKIEKKQDLLRITEPMLANEDEYEVAVGKFLIEWLNEDDFVTVKTSGSTGVAKEITVSKYQMINSATATARFFNLPASSTALLCLSPNHIAGKMMLVRAMVLGWNLQIVAPDTNALIEQNKDYDFVAMVPIQAFKALDLLDHYARLLIGGGPISSQLNKALQNKKVKAYSSYGMTETVSHIAVRAINGPDKSECYQALPGVEFSVDNRSCLVINAPKVASGKVITNDVVELKSKTEFKWLGRYDNIINSGGIKLNPEAIEAKISEEIKSNFIITSEADEALGERVILVLEQTSKEIPSNLKEKIFAKLEKYERPKKIYTVPTFPKTETDKIKRGELLKILKQYN